MSFFKFLFGLITKGRLFYNRVGLLVMILTALPRLIASLKQYFAKQPSQDNQNSYEEEEEGEVIDAEYTVVTEDNHKESSKDKA